MTCKDRVLTYAVFRCLDGFTAPAAARAAGCTPQHAYKTLSVLRGLRRAEVITTHNGRDLVTVRYYVDNEAEAAALAAEVALVLTCTTTEAESWFTS